ncbi:MAG TPA: UMP kinase [Methanospirillum sp.]|nr:UMP kinase [Methanospirillum sp.]
MSTIVLSLGGSILLPGLDTPNIKPYIPVLVKIAKAHRLFIVVGGGGEARRYIDVAKSIGCDEASADELGILVTRLNATLLINALGRAAWPEVLESHNRALAAAESGKIVVMGGITPGQTTDAVAAVLAERVSADVFFNLTSVDGIYSADPRKNPGAIRHEMITPSELLEIVIRQQATAGVNTVMDIIAVKMVERCNIPLIVLDGRDPQDLLNAVENGTCLGTVVSKAGVSPLPLK